MENEANCAMRPTMTIWLCQSPAALPQSIPRWAHLVANVREALHRRHTRPAKLHEERNHVRNEEYPSYETRFEKEAVVRLEPRRELGQDVVVLRDECARREQGEHGRYAVDGDRGGVVGVGYADDEAEGHGKGTDGDPEKVALTAVPEKV